MAKLLVMLNVVLMPKGFNHKFNDYLDSYEVHCGCNRKNCHFTIINSRTVEAYTKARKEFAKVMRINSFFRCQEHNKELAGSVAMSSHTTGNAIDISTRGFTGFEKTRLEEILRKYFDVVLVNDTFIHVHLNPEDFTGGMCLSN